MQFPIVITGASSGIGRESALFLASKGYRVFATMRDISRGADLVRQSGGLVELVPLEITDPESIRRCVETVVERAGGIGALVNNAGIQVRGYFEDLTEQEIRSVFETNVFGTMAITRAALPYLRNAGKSRIVFVTSVGGLIGSHGLSAYCSSKFALEGFAEALRLEVAPLNIEVSLVEPGIIATEIWGRNKGVAHRSEDTGSPYFALFKETEKWADWAVETSPIRPTHVARAIHHALTSRRPRMRYLIGVRPAVLLALRRILPGELFDRVYRYTMTARLRKILKSAEA